MTDVGVGVGVGVDQAPTAVVLPAVLPSRRRLVGSLAGSLAGRLVVSLVAGLGVVTVALLVIGGVLHAHTGETRLTGWWLGDTLLSISLLVPGLLVAVARPANAVGWLLCFASLIGAVGAAGREYLAYGFLGGYAPGHLWVGWAADGIYLMSMASLPLALMLFPDGRPLSSRTRPLLAVPVVAGVLGSIGRMFSDGNSVDVRGRELRNPAEDVLPHWLPAIAVTVAMALFFASVITAIVLLVLRYRRADDETRVQMRWVTWAGALGLLELVTEFFTPDAVSRLTGPAASFLLVGSVCLAILRHRLFDIDLVINRTVVFALLTGAATAAYLLVVVCVDLLFGYPMRIGPGLAATVVIALAVAPARNRLQAAVDRRMYGDRSDPYRVMNRLGERLERPSPDELTAVAETLSQALRLPLVEIVDADGHRLACVGAAGRTTTISLIYGGEHIGELRVGIRRDQRELSRGERAVLEQLVRPIGSAVHSARLSADLMASRRRLIAAKEEERRRLRRDLHDGLGPQLAALGLKADAARAVTESDPEQSRLLMASVADDVRATIDMIRRLVHGLRPPTLDELGLVGALRESATSLTSSGMGVVVRAVEPLPALPAAVEVAAYGITIEAMTNAVRHSGGTRCEAVLSMDTGPSGAVLRVEVGDDGRGSTGATPRGVGSSSMRERAEELGGRLEVAAGAAGGVVVRALLPCEGE